MLGSATLMTTSILRSLTRAARGSRGAHSRDAAERAAPPVIALADVGMTYPNGKTALSDVSVEIPERDFVFLVGQSGAGKSTFIRLLIREQVATTGRVIVAGRDLGRLRRRQVPALRRVVQSLPVRRGERERPRPEDQLMDGTVRQRACDVGRDPQPVSGAGEVERGVREQGRQERQHRRGDDGQQGAARHQQGDPDAIASSRLVDRPGR